MALKIFRARLGFYDSVLATNSSSRALRLWGVKQDLFKTGSAEETKDKALVAAASEQPHTPLYRAAGSSGKFTEKPRLTAAEVRSVMKKKT